MSLLAHTKATELEVLSVPEPEWTKSWHPVSHARCFHVLKETAQTFDLTIRKKDYSLSKDGAKLFGSWVVGEENEIAQAIVFRNSLDKTMSFGIVVGTHAFVCDNLAFSGDFVEFRKHTSGMDDKELQRVVSNGFDIILPKMERFQQWHEALHEVKLIPSKMKELCYNAVIEGVIKKTKIQDFNRLLFGNDETEAIYNSRELFGFHGANTQILRDSNMAYFHNSERQMHLHKFINDKYGKFLPIINEN